MEKALGEVYKQLPKTKKEEIDPVLTDILAGKEAKKVTAGAVTDFPALETEILEFLGNAYAHSKQKRSRKNFEPGAVYD